MPGHQSFEGLVVLPPHDAFFSDPDPLEERLVHQASTRGLGQAVGLAAVAGQSDGRCHVGFNPFDRPSRGKGASLQRLHLPADAGLFLHEQVQGHRIGVVSVQELGALAFELLQTPGLSNRFGLLCLQLLTGFGEQDSSRGFEPLGVELHLAVVVDDLFLDEHQRPVLQLAGVSLLMPPQAEVIRVAHALLAGGVGDAEPATAVAAPDGALQVVMMLPLL